MGVGGLHSFVKRNSVLSQRIHLTDTKLVIDATDLLCTLFGNLCRDPTSSQWRCDIYGGDLVAYGKAVEEFFDSLDKCGICPILVFEGSKQGKQSTGDQERKLHKKGVKRFLLVQRMTEECPKYFVVSKSTRYIFKSIVRDRGYQRIQAPFEAEAHIARIANDLNCYVLTDHTDFFIYSLPKGFVMLDSFDYKNTIPTEAGRHRIDCKLCTQTKLFEHFPGLEAESMPLLGVLLSDHEYVAGRNFYPLHSTISAEEATPLVAESRSHQRIVAILAGLRNKTREESIECILGRIRYADRTRARQTIDTILRRYRIEETYNIEAELSEIYPTSRADPSIRTDCPELLPPAYLCRLFQSDLNSIALDMIFHNTHHARSSIDDRLFEFGSASRVRNRAFEFAITLLRPSSSDRSAFDLYDRVDEDYGKITLRPMEHSDGFGSLEHLNCYSMIQLEPERKKSLLMHIFMFTDDELNQMTDVLSQVFTGQFLIEARTCFMLVKYIGLETRCKPEAYFVDALMLTLLDYASKNGFQLNEDSFDPCKVHLNVWNLLFSHSYRNNNEQDDPERVYRRIMHFISQLEAAYSGYCLLNTLLDHVFEAPRYELFLNGTLVFRLTKLLRQGKIELATLRHERPTLVEACTSMKVMVQCDQ